MQSRNDNHRERTMAVVELMRVQLREGLSPSLHDTSDTLYDERGLPT